jgi:hypothetical protein
MQWILQEDQCDIVAISETLDRLQLPYSLHKIIPFIGLPLPAPEIIDPTKVIFLGLASTRFYAREHGLTPGVFFLRPFVLEEAWQPFLLNSRREAVFATSRDILEVVRNDPRELFFVRPVEDTKTLSGRIMTVAEIEDTVQKVLKLEPTDIPEGSFAHDTELMIFDPVTILQEWRVWIVDNKIVTYSLYKSGSTVVYRNEIDDDAKKFAAEMVAINPGYAKAYVMDVCRTPGGLKLLETNCCNSAGFYAADLFKFVEAIEYAHA